MKKWIIVIGFLVFTIFTFLVLFTDRGKDSSQLTQETVSTDHQTRTDYLEEEGRIAFASDKGYATVIKTYEGKNVVLEEYLDEAGRAVTLSSGYSKISRQYNSLGQAEVITYLDEAGEPVKLAGGYSAIHRTYNEAGKPETDTYYDQDEQVSHRNGYYGYKREYSDGKISRMSYLDRDGSLTLHKNGYAVIERTYNSAGKVVYEFYLDTEGQPATSTLGQYGVYREYDENGSTVLTVYLDADGNPMNTKKGYATVRREGDKRLYFDAEGNPATGGSYQFGYTTIDGKTVYLAEDGEPYFRLDRFLFSNPLLVMIGGVILTVIACTVKGKPRIVFLILYLLLILLMTLWYREPGESVGSFELFRSYRKFFISMSTRLQILENVWLFVPFGAALYRKESRRWLIPFFCSACIEAIQFVAGIGFCEIDDVISNGFGGLLGYELAQAVSLFSRGNSGRSIKSPGLRET